MIQTSFADSLSEFDHVALNAKHTVILDYDGIRRYYPCENALDAVILMHALCKTYPEVELWEGDKLVQKYKAF